MGYRGRSIAMVIGRPFVAAAMVMLSLVAGMGHALAQQAMALQPGTRLVVDQGQPITAPYVVCIANGCMADYEASQELINNMKKGSGLILQAINGGGQPVSITLPLADFAKAHDGAPMEQKE